MFKMIECPDCENGTCWKSRYGGLDPDVRPYTCEECDGTGEIEVEIEDEEEE
jgi:hypothetical protein